MLPLPSSSLTPMEPLPSSTRPSGLPLPRSSRPMELLLLLSMRHPRPTVPPNSRMLPPLSSKDLRSVGLRHPRRMASRLVTRPVERTLTCSGSVNHNV